MSKARELANLGNAYSDGALSNRNRIINGNFDVWQRGTSITSNNAIDYIADRWATFANGDITTSRQSFTAGQTDVPNEPAYFVRWDVNTYASGDNYFQKIEDVRTLAGQTATISFYAKADTAITIRPRFIQNFGSGGSAEVVTAIDVANVTTSWQKFTITTSIPSISGKTIGTASYLEIELLRITDSFTGYIDLAQVQLEVGDTSTPFEHRSYADQLQACQRYFQRHEPLQLKGTMTTGTQFGRNGAILPVEMRATPTITLTSIGASGHNEIYDGVNSYRFSGSISGNYSNNKKIELDGTVTTSTTAGRPAIWFENSANKTRFDLSAEL